MKKFDVIILGGGPAGAATAIALVKHGYSVLIIERSHYEDWRVGETLPPHVCRPLADLAVWDRFCQAGHLPSPAIYAAWGGADLYPTHFISNPYGHGWHLDRRRFDAMLALSAESAGATLLQGARVTSAFYMDLRWHVLIHSGGEQALHLEASFLVDATGRAGWLTRALGKKRISYDTMLALVGVLTAQTSASLVDPVLCLEAAEDGWWYSAPVPDGSLVVVYMTDRDYLTGRDQPPTLFWRNQLERTMHTLAHSQGFHLGDEGKVHVKSASTYILERPAGEGWLAVGDAACTYDPLSGEGITKALASALRAAETIHATLQDDARAMDKYVVELAREFDGYLVQRARYYHQETRWSTSSFWLRRQVARLATEL